MDSTTVINFLIHLEGPRRSTTFFLNLSAFILTVTCLSTSLCGILRQGQHWHGGDARYGLAFLLTWRKKLRPIASPMSAYVCSFGMGTTGENHSHVANHKRRKHLGLGSKRTKNPEFDHVWCSTIQRSHLGIWVCLEIGYSMVHQESL